MKNQVSYWKIKGNQKHKQQFPHEAMVVWF
jgi:hypothetical protein